MLNNLKMNNEVICLLDSATTHTILTSNKTIFFKLTMMETKVNTISGFANVIERFGKTNIICLEKQNSQLIMHSSLVNQREIY